MRIDAAENIVNAVVGLLVSWLAVLQLFRLFGMHPTTGGAAGVTALFFELSSARAFVLRRLFSDIEGSRE